MVEQPLRSIRHQLGMTQEEFAEFLDVTQQSVSRAERGAVVSDYFARRVGAAIRKRFPEREKHLLAMLERVDSPDQARFQLEVQKEIEKAGPEGDAWSFALQFRNALMLDRLACHGFQVGLSATRLADGVAFSGRKVGNPGSGLNDLLYPCPKRVGIESGMVVFVGDPQRHDEAAKVVFQAFSNHIRSNRWEVKFGFFDAKPANFGYATFLKQLRVKKTIYRPRRYVDDDGMAVCYEDYGVIFSAGLGLLKGPNPFGDQAKQIVLICGLHRLATGAGVKLLEDLDFREAVLKDAAFDFPSGKRLGVLAYRVVLRTDNRLWSNERDFKWSHSDVKELTILAAWSATIRHSGPTLHVAEAAG